MVQETHSAFTAIVAPALPAVCTMEQAQMWKFAVRESVMPREKQPEAGPLFDAAAGDLDG